MIADANDEKVKEAAKNDETMRRMQKEMSDMVQDKEVRNMIMQEKFDRMDWITYGSDQREEGANLAAKLMQKLYSLGKAKEAERASNEPEYLKKLLKDYGFVKA